MGDKSIPVTLNPLRAKKMAFSPVPHPTSRRGPGWTSPRFNRSMKTGWGWSISQGGVYE